MQQFRFAQKAFIVDDGKLLLVKKSKDDPYHPDEWEVPGGRMEFGEEIEEHIKREVKEEVGLDIEIGSPFVMWTWILQKDSVDGESVETQIVAVGSHCRALNVTVSDKGRVEEDYLADIEWVPVENIFNYKLIPDIIPAMKKFVEKYQQQ